MKKYICFVIIWAFVYGILYAQNLPTIHAEGGKYALVDTKTGTLLTTYKYEDITSFQEDVAVATWRTGAGKFYTYLNTKGQEIILPTTNRLSPFVQGRAIFRKNGKFGFLSRQGQEIIPAQYNQVFDFQEYVSIVVKENKKMVIDTVGKLLCIIPPDYETAQKGYSDGVLPIYATSKSHALYIDKQGKAILDLPILETPIKKAHEFIKNTAIIELNKTKGLIDKQGKWILQPIFAEIERVEEGFWVSQEEKIYSDESRYVQGLYGSDFQLILPCKYKILYQKALPNMRVFEQYAIPAETLRNLPNRSLSLSYFEVQDSVGKIIFPHQAKDIWITNQGEFIAQIDSIYEIYTSKGERTGIRGDLKIGYEIMGALEDMELKPYIRDNKPIKTPKNDIICIKFNKKIAFADKSSKKLCTDFFDEFLYIESAENYQDMFFRKENKWIYKDSIYEDVGVLDKNLILLKKQKKWAIFDRVFQKNVTKFMYDSIIPSMQKLKFEDRENSNLFGINYDLNFMPENSIIASYQNNWGVIDKKNNIVIPFQFEAIRDMYYQYMIVEKDKKLGVLDYKGKIIFPCIAEHLEVIGDYIYAYQSNKVAMYNFQNQLLTKKYYDSIAPYQKGNIVVFEKGKMGWLDQYGNTIFPPIYEEINKISYGNKKMKNFIRKNYPPYILLKQNGKYGLANLQYQIILPTIYDDIDTGEFLLKNLIVATLHNKKGLFDCKGTTLLPPIYDDIENLGIAFIDDESIEQARQIPSLDIASYYARVTIQGVQGVFDLAGKLFLPIVYEHIEKIQEKNALKITKNGKTQEIILPTR